MLPNHDGGNTFGHELHFEELQHRRCRRLIAHPAADEDEVAVPITLGTPGIRPVRGRAHRRDHLGRGEPVHVSHDAQVRIGQQFPDRPVERGPIPMHDPHPRQIEHPRRVPVQFAHGLEKSRRRNLHGALLEPPADALRDRPGDARRMPLRDLPPGVEPIQISGDVPDVSPPVVVEPAVPVLPRCAGSGTVVRCCGHGQLVVAQHRTATADFARGHLLPVAGTHQQKDLTQVRHRLPAKHFGGGRAHIEQRPPHRVRTHEPDEGEVATDSFESSARTRRVVGHDHRRLPLRPVHHDRLLPLQRSKPESSCATIQKLSSHSETADVPPGLVRGVESCGGVIIR